MSVGGHSERGHHTDDEHYGPHDDSNVEDDAEACIVPLGPSSGPQSRDGQDEGWDGEKEADEKSTTCQQGADGEHEGAYCHSRVILSGRRHASGGCFHRLHIHHDGGFGKLRLVAVGGLIRLIDVRWRRSLFQRRVSRRKVVCLRRIALRRIAFGRRRRVLRRVTVVHGRRVAIGHLRTVGHLFLLLVELLVGVVRGRHWGELEHRYFL